MPSNKLTQVALRSALPRDKPYKLGDGALMGVGCQQTPLDVNRHEMPQITVFLWILTDVSGRSWKW